MKQYSSMLNKKIGSIIIEINLILEIHIIFILLFQAVSNKACIFEIIGVVSSKVIPSVMANKRLHNYV